jgi:hypothetical protein
MSPRLTSRNGPQHTPMLTRDRCISLSRVGFTYCYCRGLLRTSPRGAVRTQIVGEAATTRHHRRQSCDSRGLRGHVK